jgi:hypothetical protein
MAARAGEHSHNPGATLGKFRMIGQIEIRPDGNDQEWFRLRSPVLTSKQLFNMLEAVWPAIVGAEPQKYALIHCLGGQSTGVWLHLLPNTEYAPGCHEVTSL